MTHFISVWRVVFLREYKVDETQGVMRLAYRVLCCHASAGEVRASPEQRAQDEFGIERTHNVDT